MSNAVSTFLGGGNALTKPGEFANALNAHIKPVAPASYDGSFLKFDDLDNLWTYGAARDVINTDESTFAANVMSFRAGYHHWKNNQHIEMVAGIGELPIDPSTLDTNLGINPPNHKYAPNQPIVWDPFMSIMVQGVEGPDQGVKLRLDASGKGLRGALAALMEEVTKRTETDPVFFVPLFQFTASKYFNKVRSKDSYWPALEIVGWGDVQGNKASPVKTRKRASSAPVDEAPKRTRRRRVAA